MEARMADTTNLQPDPNEKLVVVFETEQDSEAQVVKGLLESAEIESDLRARELTQENFPGMGGVQILVREEDAADAKEIIEAYRQSPPVDDETAEISG
jgi:hypothetical protein